MTYGTCSRTFTVDVLDFYELSAEVEAINGDGYNESGSVGWILYITGRYNGNHTPFSFRTDWPDQNGFGGNQQKAWENACNGVSGMWSYCCSDRGYGKYHGGIACVLPDDPAIAGEYTTTLMFGGLQRTVRYTLVYQGDYETGTGWTVENVSWS